MSKIFEFNAQKGSMLNQVDKSALTNSGTTFKQTELGLATYVINPNYLSYNISLNGTYSLVAFISCIAYNNTANHLIADFRNAGGTGYLSIQKPVSTVTVYSSSGTKYVNDVQTTTITNIYSFNCVILTGITINCTSVRLFNAVSDTSTSLNGYCCYVAIYEGGLTSTERTKIYDKFLHTFPLAINKDNFYYAKPLSLSQSNLVAAYNMIPSAAGVLFDISGNGYNGTITTALSTQKGLKFNGINSKIVLGNIGNIKSLAFRIKFNSTSEKILEGAANNKLIYANSGTLTYSDFDNAFVNGVDSDAINANIWLNIVIISSDNVNMSALTIALNNATYGNFELQDLRIYSDEKDINFAIKYNNLFTNQINYFNDFRYEKADGTNILPTGFIQGTGSYKIGELTANDSILTHLKKGTKYLECIIAGTIAFLSNQAYNIWEFDLYKNLDGNASQFYFIASDKYGTVGTPRYRFDFASNESIRILNTAGNIIMATAISYIQIQKFYRIRIERNKSVNQYHTGAINSIRTLIKGGNYGNIFQSISVDGGSGSNPVVDSNYTSSIFSVVDLDAGDRITNFKYYN